MARTGKWAEYVFSTRTEIILLQRVKYLVRFWLLPPHGDIPMAFHGTTLTKESSPSLRRSPDVLVIVYETNMVFSLCTEITRHGSSALAASSGVLPRTEIILFRSPNVDSVESLLPPHGD